MNLTNKRYSRLIASVFIVVGSSSIFGCASNAPTHFYLLTPKLSENQNSSTSAIIEQSESGKRTGIRIVTLPEYLNRSAMVTRSTPNELEVSTTDKWGEPLAENVTRVLISNIGSQCNGLSFITLPQLGIDDTKIELRTSFIRFERENNQIILQAHAMLMDKNSSSTLNRQFFEVREECAGGNASDTTECMSTALAKLSDRLAGVMQSAGACEKAA